MLHSYIWRSDCFVDNLPDSSVI